MADEAPAELILADYRAEDEATYQAFLADMEKQFPPPAPLPFDFSALTGNLCGRSAKAIALHMRAACCWSPEQIAAVLGKTVKCVRRYLTEAIQEALPIDDADIAIIRQLDLLKLEADEAWLKREAERSCQDEVTETETWVVEDGEGNLIPADAEMPGARRTVKRVTKGQAGNPAYSRALTDIRKRRAALLGLDSPTKVQVDKRSVVLNVKETIITTHEEAKALAAQLLESPN